MEFKRIEDIEDISALSKEDREKYSESIKVYRDNLATGRRRWRKGRGLEKGLEKEGNVTRMPAISKP